MLTAKMEKLIRENTIGLIATVTPDGKPAVSPKATTVIVDPFNIAFCDLRSPNTRRNIEANPAVEINYIDVFSRQACRLTGLATYITKNTLEFDLTIPLFKTWDDLFDSINGIFRVEILNAEHIFSPAYDHGAKEGPLKKEWLTRYNELLG